MATISELVPLLYRARSIPFSFAARVESSNDSPGSAGQHETSWRRERAGSLLAAPGGRYRADLVDEDGDRLLTTWDGTSGGMPFPELLDPSWLLAVFDLVITAQVDYLGRSAYAIAGRCRPAADERARRSADRVTGLVDAELGILLRFDKTHPGRGTESAAFTQFQAQAPESADPRLFVEQDQAQLDLDLDHAGQNLAGRPERSGSAVELELSDEQVNLLYRTQLGPQRFSAELHEWDDPATMMRLAAAAIEPGSLASEIRWLWEPGDTSHAAIDLAGRLRVAMPGSYRIDAITDPGRRPSCVACDGNQLWQVYPDRVVVRPPAPPPEGISAIIDPAWLLCGFSLSSGGIAEVAGRRGLSVTALPKAPLWPRKGPLSRNVATADQIEAVIDLELGVILSQSWKFEGCPVFRCELARVTDEVEQAVFRIEPSPGTRVISGGPLAEMGLSPVRTAWTIASGASRLAFDIARRWAKRPRG